VRLRVLILGEGWKLEQGLLDGAIVINMNRVFEHVVYEVRVWLHKVIQDLQYLQVLLLAFKKGAECHVITVEFNCGYRLE
jgi:hypothetical protein